MPVSSLPSVLGGILAAVVTAGVVVSRVRRAVIQIRSDRRLRAKARQRALLRQPCRGTLVMEGRIVVSSSQEGSPDSCVVTRCEYGCLGGPIVHDVLPFLLETDLGERVAIEVGNDPIVENLGSLTDVSGSATDAAPPPSGAPHSIKILRGRVRVAGVVVAAPGKMAPPPRHSAVVTILSS